MPEFLVILAVMTGAALVITSLIITVLAIAVSGK